VLRIGGVPVEDIEKVVGKVKVIRHSTSNPAAPGMLKSHYAPRVPLVIDEVENILQQYTSERIAVLAFAKYHPRIPIKNQLLLSPKSDLKKAAQNLFAYLRLLDQMDVDVIVTSYVPNEGLGRAINDKLRRASA
jgi:L-threonylcarbamoyladenylate synthase